MVNITYKAPTAEDSLFRIICTGHASYAEKGKDIVCSSVSILLYTLVESLLKHPEYYGKGGLKYSLETGKAMIDCKSKNFPMAEDMLDEVFETIVTGFELLAQNYPNNVKLDRK